MKIENLDNARVLGSKRDTLLSMLRHLSKDNKDRRIRIQARYKPDEAYDVVSYWDDYDRKVVNPKPLLYSEACKLCEKYLSTRPSGSLYHYAVEVHK